MKDIVKLTTLEQIKTYSDPYRLKIITLIRNNKEPLTVKEIADKLEEVPAKVHYHIKKLEKAGIIELVRTKEIKGIIAKYYYLTANSYELVGENINEHSKKIYKSQVLTVINEFYEKSKNMVMDSVSERINKGNDINFTSLVDRKIYLTTEEFQELNGQIKEILYKYEKKREGTDSWHVFNVVCKDGEDKK